MEKTSIQEIWPAGRFDQSLMPYECNSKMFELMGEFVYSSLYKMLAVEDVQRMKDALGRSKENLETVVEECVHLLNGQGTYETYIAGIFSSQNSKRYYIELRNMQLGERILKSLEIEKNLFQDFLTLSGAVCFTYRPSDDFFTIFWMDYEQKVEIYAMPFEKWEHEMLEHGWIDAEDTAIFQTFCNSVRKASGRQDYTFHGSVLTKGHSKEAYRIKFIPRSWAEENLVEGIWLNVNEQTGDVVDDYMNGINLEPLTRLLNKRAITDYAIESLEKGERPTIVMLDIDNFKSINDNYGHPFGDQVIAAVADVIKRVIGNHGVAGRMGGDEFLIVLKDCSDELGLRNYLRGIRSFVSTLFQDKVADNKITCSLGAARYGIEAESFGDLYRIADKALYIAKQKGKNRYVIYKPELHGRFNTDSDDMDMKEIKESFYSEEKLNRFSLSLSELVLHGSGKLSMLLKQSSDILNGDRVMIFWGEPRKLICSYPEELEMSVSERKALESKEYQELFNNDMLSITNVNRFEFSMPEMFELCKKYEVRSTMQHFLRGADGEIKGFVCVHECRTMGGFSSLTVQLFKNMCRVINAVLLREEQEENRE